MQVLSKKSLNKGGFAGLREVRVVTDSKIAGANKDPKTSQGLGNFVYLADANFNPLGETGMHPHKEIDVISVMIDGRVAHKGSLEHGQELKAGEVQVQRAGGEGFSHNEVNPDNSENRMIQLWVLPETEGECAAYKMYQPQASGVTRIYGGNEQQAETFASQTVIEIVNLAAGDSVAFENEQLSYVTSGLAQFIEGEQKESVTDGDLVRSESVTIQAKSDVSIIVISQPH
ncbi:MAG: pilus assembly protein [Moraxellaceae bacterium]|nr:MAG: pilus assembly protein [Moraxellaceae bacterium]